MSREEAIKELEFAKLTDDYMLHEALDMAIQALEQEPCEDAINRQAIINAIANTCFWLSADNWEELIKCINSIPPVKPQEKTGYWIKTPKAVMGEGYMWYCDKCGYQVYQDTSRPYPSEKYCPNCGAKMESEDK